MEETDFVTTDCVCGGLSTDVTDSVRALGAPTPITPRIWPGRSLRGAPDRRLLGESRWPTVGTRPGLARPALFDLRGAADRSPAVRAGLSARSMTGPRKARRPAQGSLGHGTWMTDGQLGDDAGDEEAAAPVRDGPPLPVPWGDWSQRCVITFAYRDPRSGGHGGGRRSGCGALLTRRLGWGGPRSCVGTSSGAGSCGTLSWRTDEPWSSGDATFVTR
jgi:hypothetical protein